MNIGILIYNIVIRLYVMLITLASPFNKKAHLWLRGRSNFFSGLQSRMYKNTAPVIWFHCASLGEFEQARPLLEEIKNQYPQYNIFLTFFSPSGYEIRKNYEKADYVFYLPVDTSFNARKFIRVVNPKLVFFAKYEFWYHYINELHKKRIPAISFSAIFRKEQIFFKSYGAFYKEVLKNLTKIFVQNKESYGLLKSHNISNIEIAGDTRFDRVKSICENKKDYPLIKKFKSDKKLLVVGSSWKKDIEILIELINGKEHDLKIIIAPHEIHSGEISFIENKLNLKSIRYSYAKEQDIDQYELLIINNIGMLSSLYQYADFAYIGGAFEKGLHNILEPATFGMPIFFGPKYDKFQEAKDLIELGVAFSVKDEMDLKEKFSSIYTNEQKRLLIVSESKKYIERNTGATNQILNYCKQFLG
jgi:3-deoxy-D-manno-octulosonic-acid transferase